MQQPSTNKTATIRDVIRLAWPASVASSVTPLLGVVDVWALAQSTRPIEVAAVGLGSVIFSLIYWTFGFIRMGVAGLAAQAAGAHDDTENRAVLARGLAIGCGVGLVFVMLQAAIAAFAFPLLAIGSEASEATFESARAYFNARIWGAPFALGAYAMLGWFSANGRTDYLMAASLITTGLNIVLDYWFVIVLDLGAAGVAAGTAIAETAGFIAALFLVARILARRGGLRAHWSRERLIAPDALRRTFSINRDIFIRTLLIAGCFAWFTQRGGAFGDATLAANQVLLQLFLFTGLALDGTAIAAETLVGQAISDPHKDRRLARLSAAVRATFLPAIIASLGFTLLYGVFGATLVNWLTDGGLVRDVALDHRFWVTISPLIVVLGFQLDGIFVGATRAREMRDSMIISTLMFIPMTLFLAGKFGNHGLWASFSVYFLARAATLALHLPRLLRSGANGVSD
ncbi:MAG: MATE family efflux transporter [Pseudomonadota bacterium]